MSDDNWIKIAFRWWRDVFSTKAASSTTQALAPAAPPRDPCEPFNDPVKTPPGYTAAQIHDFLREGFDVDKVEVELAARCHPEITAAIQQAAKKLHFQGVEPYIIKSDRYQAGTPYDHRHGQWNPEDPSEKQIYLSSTLLQDSPSHVIAIALHEMGHMVQKPESNPYYPKKKERDAIYAELYDNVVHTGMYAKDYKEIVEAWRSNRKVSEDFGGNEGRKWLLERAPATAAAQLEEVVQDITSARANGQKPMIGFLETAHAHEIKELGKLRTFGGTVSQEGEDKHPSCAMREKFIEEYGAMPAPDTTPAGKHHPSSPTKKVR